MATVAVACNVLLPAGLALGEEILKVKKSTFVNLVDLLVKRGVLDRKEGDGLVTAAEEEGKATASAAPPNGTTTEKPVESADFSAVAPKSTTDKQGKKTLHVSYVPEFIKREIREQVRSEVRREVTEDIKAHAQKQKWGIPDALPEWLNTFKLSGDLRLRFADDIFDEGNVVPPRSAYLDYLAINRERSFQEATRLNEAYLNSNIDRLRLRERFRLALDAQITDGLKAGFRFATSNIRNPVSNNQTLGNTGQSWEFAIDRAFLQYDFVDGKGNDWFSLYGGRIVNPFFSTDVVFDPDLSFEGFAGTFRYRFNQTDSLVQGYHAPRPTARAGINLGPQTPDTVFATLGIFPIQEVNFSTRDKWLFAGQIGGDWLFSDESRVKIALSYYDFENLRARRNSFAGNRESSTYDWTAPQFVQKGNSMVPINDSVNQPTSCPASGGASDICLFGLASDFRVVNFTTAFDLARFSPLHVMLTFDYAKNLAYDRTRIGREFGTAYALSGKTDAFQIRLDAGNFETLHFKDWNLFLAYRYLERDAVLDAFTDSVFHLGGTDAKGWVLGANYGIAKGTWVNLRWFTADAIDGPTNNPRDKPLGIDTLTVDLNARF